MIVVKCKSCGATFKAPDEYAGRSGKCHRCGERVQIIRNENTEQIVYAGFWRRFAASVIDWAVLGCVANQLYWWVVNLVYWWVVNQVYLWRFAIHARIVFDLRPESYEQAKLIAYVISIPLLIVIKWSYFAGLESSPLKATIGKICLGIYVTDLDGKRISFARATGRHFGKAVSAIMLLVGFLMAGLTQEKQALHDIMAACLVLRK